MSCCIFKRRALALNSKMDRAGVSSTKIGASSSVWIAPLSRSQSSPARFPFFIFSDPSSDSDAISRFTSCMDAISREKIPTGFFQSTAMLRVIDKTNAVLPMAGRAATIIRSVFCHPEVMRSTPVNPEGIPDSPSSRLLASSIS